MMTEFEFAAKRIRQSIETSDNTGNILFHIGRYLLEAVTVGHFSGVKFAEFRGDLIDAKNPTTISPFRVLRAINWLCENGRDVGINFPNLPQVVIPSTSYPLRSIVLPYLNAVTDMIAAIPDSPLQSESGEDSRWIRHGEAAASLDMKAPAFSKLASDPESGIRDNGKSGPDRRIDPLSLIEYARAKQIDIAFNFGE